VNGEKAKTKKKFDFKAQTVSPKSIFSREEVRIFCGIFENFGKIEKI